MIWIVYLCLVLCVSGLFSDGIPTTLLDDDYCEKMNCVGLEYLCIDRKCYCADGYIPNYSHVKCVKCPGLGDKCYGTCCSDSTSNYANETLQCWQGVCRQCYDIYGNWICSENVKEIMLISSAEIARCIALVLAVIVLYLFYKLCSTKDLSPIIGSRLNNRLLSVGSLQLHIEERLRDAPPSYSIATLPDAPHPFTIYLNNGFVHDSSIPPPPPYTSENNVDRRNAILHL